MSDRQIKWGFPPDEGMLEICNECGKSVAPGSGNFVNRVPSGDDEATHREMGKPFPKGGFICGVCEAEIDD